MRWKIRPQVQWLQKLDQINCWQIKRLTNLWYYYSVLSKKQALEVPRSATLRKQATVFLIFGHRKNYNIWSFIMSINDLDGHEIPFTMRCASSIGNGDLLISRWKFCSPNYEWFQFVRVFIIILLVPKQLCRPLSRETWRLTWGSLTGEVIGSRKILIHDLQTGISRCWRFNSATGCDVQPEV